MAVLENLVEGLSNAAGSDVGKQVEKLKADRKATQHEELEGKTKGILDDVSNLQARRAALPAGDPGIADIDKSLAEHQQAFRDLYHPIKNPGNLQKLGGFLKQHLTGQAPKPAPQSNEVTPERMAGLNASAAGTQANPFELKKRALIATGVPEDEATRLATGQKDPKPANVKYGLVQGTLNGQPMTLQHGADGTWKTMGGADVDEDTVNQFIPAKAGASGKPIRAWKNVNGKVTSVLLDPASNKEIPGSENSDIQPPSTMTSRISTGFYHYVDGDGNVHQIAEQRTSTPAGIGGRGSVAKTPGEAKDRVIGKKETPVQSKAHSTYIAAYQLSQAADLVAKEPENAQSQKSLGVALERAAAGRFTTQALDYILKAGWSAGAEKFWNNIDNGTLPKVVLNNLIQRAHDNKNSAYDAWQESRKPSGDTSGPPPTNAKPSGKAVSLAAAKRLPQNQGKSDDEIRKDIEAHGHKVIP